MYRLLIVTGNPEVRNMFEAMEGWESLGFKPPRLRENTQEALECMSRHQIDAIAMDPSPALDDLRAYLEEKCPTMLRFPLASGCEEQEEIVRELGRTLRSLHADHSNAEYDLKSALYQCRERLLKTVVCGLVPTERELRRRLYVLNCFEKPDVPCVLARLSMDSDDPFLTSRWHYGSERLETALRNFFGVRQDDMLLHVAVVSPQEVRVLCYPQGEEALREEAVRAYVNETIRQIDNYLGLHMAIAETRVMPGLAAFAEERLKRA